MMTVIELNKLAYKKLRSAEVRNTKIRICERLGFEGSDKRDFMAAFDVSFVESFIASLRTRA